MVNLLRDLYALWNKKHQKPKVRFFEDNEGIILAHSELLKSIEKEYFYFGSVAELIKILGEEYMVDFSHRRIEKKIQSNGIRYPVDKAIVRPEIASSDKEHYRNIRYFNSPIIDSVAIMFFFDNKIVITSTQKECYSMIIESWEMANLMKFIWKALWSASIAVEG